MEIRRWIAAVGALLLHALVVISVLVFASPMTARETPKPLTVRLVEAPRPLPAAPPAPKVTEPAPAPAAPPPPAPPQPAPPPPPPPVPKPAPKPVARKSTNPKPASVVAATPLAVDRTQAISAPPAPANTPPGPTVNAPPQQSEPAAAAPPPPPREPVRTGPRLEASWAGNQAPIYPAMARRLGEQGEVRLDVRVGANGEVTEIQLKQSSGSKLLDQTAIETVKKWKFKPATVDGQPVAAWYQDWKWVFKLEN